MSRMGRLHGTGLRELARRARLRRSVADQHVLYCWTTLLAVGSFGQGRSLAWASDIGPHWCPEPFATWEGYARLWNNAIQWLAARTG
jgi:uncharacterized membrane protein